jgi:RHS repeat-associated protein
VQNAVSTSQALAFDNLGRTLASRQITDGVNYDSAYLYNLSGALVEETYPSGRKVKNTFEADGDLSKIETQVSGGAYQVRAQNLSYTSSGVLEKLQIGNGLWETAQLNSRLQVTQLGLGTSPTDASLWKLNYDFGTTNNDGNIKSQTLTTPGGTFNQTFVYDSLDRLKQATETSGGNQNWIQNFSYDRYGNRVGFNQTINGQTTNGTPSVDVNTNRFNAGQGYVYDFAGNVVQDPQNRQFIFNGDNKQVQVKDASQNVIGTYFYDGDGKRIKKVSNLDTTTFVYSGGKLVAEYSLTTATPTNPTTQYLGTDMLESPRIITDQNAQVVSRRDFMPYGEDIPNFGARTQANGYKPDNLRQKFTSYEKDNETGLDFAEARYYHSSVGRFTAVDPLLASGKSANPQTFNRYVYSLNRPLILVDPSGMQSGKPVYYHKAENGIETWSRKKHEGYTKYTGPRREIDASDGNRYRVSSTQITKIGKVNKPTDLESVSQQPSNDPVPTTVKNPVQDHFSKLTDNTAFQVADKVTNPDAWSAGASVSFGGSSYGNTYTITRDFDTFKSTDVGLDPGSAASAFKNIPSQTFSFGKFFSVSLSAGPSFILEPNSTMTRTERFNFYNGQSVSVQGCVRFCVGTTAVQSENGVRRSLNLGISPFPGASGAVNTATPTELFRPRPQN